MELRDSFLAAIEEDRKVTCYSTSHIAVTAMDIWGQSIPAIIRVLLEKARELGREYRPQLEAAAQGAVDTLVALDLPWVPASIEGKIDEVTKQLGYAAIKSVLDALLAE